VRARFREAAVAIAVEHIVPATAAGVRAALGRAPLGLLVLATGCVLADGTPVVEQIDDLPRPLLLVQ
jgi:hypothetical protein